MQRILENRAKNLCSSELLVNTNPDKIVVEYENVDLTHSPEQQSQAMFCSVPASQVSEVTFGQYRPITSCNKDSWVSVREWLLQLVLWHCNAPIRNETTRSFIFYFAGMKNKVNDIFQMKLELSQQDGHDGPVSLHWLIREIHSYQTLHYLGIGLKHKTPYKD